MRTAGWSNVSALCGECASFTVMRLNLKGCDPWDNWPFTVYWMVMLSSLQTAALNTFSALKHKGGSGSAMWNIWNRNVLLFSYRLFSYLTKKMLFQTQWSVIIICFIVFLSCCFTLFYSLINLLYLHLHKSTETQNIQGTKWATSRDISVFRLAPCTINYNTQSAS